LSPPSETSDRRSKLILGTHPPVFSRSFGDITARPYLGTFRSTRAGLPVGDVLTSADGNGRFRVSGYGDGACTMRVRFECSSETA
jgi:hypothetical protein